MNEVGDLVKGRCVFEKESKVFMKILMLAIFGMVLAKGQIRPSLDPGIVNNNVTNLPAHKISSNDLIGVSVYDAPELTRTVRVSVDGTIVLPMLKRGIRAAGLLPHELEVSIAETLKSEEILVRPIITVTMIEYNSRRVSVVGAVVNAQTFQVIGETRLLDALAKAGGPSPDAGPELLLRREAGNTQTIDLTKLLSGDSEGMNVLLDGGEEIRVPVARKIFVVGNVTKPQAIPVRQPGDATVLRLLAQVEGTTPYFSDTAWIYRDDPVTKERKQIPVPLKAILQRKSDDMLLLAEDIFYIPDNSRRRRSADIAKALLGTGQSAATALIYVKGR